MRTGKRMGLALKVGNFGIGKGLELGYLGMGPGLQVGICKRLGRSLRMGEIMCRVRAC